METYTTRLNEHLEIEIYAPRQGSEKKLYTFDKHQERLNAEGYERGPFPWEVFPLLAKTLEGKLKGNLNLKVAAKDMFSSHGEWLALAVKVQKDVLLSYVNPRGLVWHRDRYVEDNFSADAEEEFNIKGIPLQQWVDLARFGDKFVKRHYGRKFAGLPRAVKEGIARAQVMLPAEGNAWPVGRSNYIVNMFDIGGCSSRASRGVRELSAAKRAGASGASHGVEGASCAKNSTQSGGLTSATLKEMLALLRKFPDEISRKEFEAQLKRYEWRQ